MSAIRYYLNIGKAPAILGALASLAVIALSYAMHFPGF